MDIHVYKAFQARANKVKDDLLAFLIEQKRAGRTVAANGAAAKGCTLLNYAGVRPDLLPWNARSSVDVVTVKEPAVAADPRGQLSYSGAAR